MFKAKLETAEDCTKKSFPHLKKLQCKYIHFYGCNSSCKTTINCSLKEYKKVHNLHIYQGIIRNHLLKGPKIL